MRTAAVIAVATALVVPARSLSRPCFGYIPGWESADKRATLSLALADFNGDGWQVTEGEVKVGDGERHVFYLDHWPALTITAVRVNGTAVPRADHCFDLQAGWFSLKNAPANGARVEVDYKWSNRLDLFAGNGALPGLDGRDVIYFNENGKLDKNPGWLSEDEDYTWDAKEADYDADGDVDVAICGNYFIKVYKNTGAGLENKPSWIYYHSGAGPFEIAWGDVNNDGYMELAVGDMWLDKFYVFKNNGGTLESAPSWSADFLNACAVAWGDMDGDGDLDLAGACYSERRTDWGFAYIFKNNNGFLENTPCWRNDPPGGRSQALAWGDVNGDGWLDFVKGIFGRLGFQDPYTDIFYSTAGVLPTAPSWECEYGGAYCFSSFLTDADADGFLDLFQATPWIIGYFREGGILEKRPSWKYSTGDSAIRDIRVGDVNADGYPDVAAGVHTDPGYPSSGNMLFLNKGNVGVTVSGFAASASARGVALRWEVSDAVAGFNLLREVKSADVATEPAKINEKLITGRSPYRYLDTAVEAGNTYCYWLEVVPLAGPAERYGPAECTAGVKTSFALAQNAPNPARTTTTFAFSVPAACDAALTVYDIAGRKVATPYAGRAKAGANELAVDVSALAPGVYAYRLEAGGASAAKRMVVVR